MDYVKKKEKEHGGCSTKFCFFCAMKEPSSYKRKATLATCFKQMPLRDDQETVLVLSSLWHIAMTHPDDQEFPNLGIFECMARLIHKGVKEKNSNWLQRHQNIYIPYYAAHVIGSYTMNQVEFAKMAAESGVIFPLLELLRGKMSWVEQRVAVRGLGHLASYEKTFALVAEYEEEMVRLAMGLACTCLHTVYASFIGVKDKRERPKYHCDLVTRGVGGLEMENSKAEEWASQLQCWSLYILNCFACKQRPLALKLICKQEFLRELCGMWGGLYANHTSPAGIGLIRILCYSKYGRKKIAESKEVIARLCSLSRSSDEWQYMGIDCLLLLLKDTETRYKVIDISALFLIDLVELRGLGDHRSNSGEAITKSLQYGYKQKNSNMNGTLEELWGLVKRTEKEREFSQEKCEQRKVLVDQIKQEANHLFCRGEVEEAKAKYSEALALCPIRLRKVRMVLFSNRAQCQLLLRNPDSAISDTTRALCLSSPANSHGKSLWRRSQAYDMKGLARESLMDCVTFINGCIKSENKGGRRFNIPYYAARMISKQMEATWIFAAARSTMALMAAVQVKMPHESEGNKGNDEVGNHEIHGKQENHGEMMKIVMENKGA